MNKKIFGTVLIVLACAMALHAGKPQKSNKTIYMYGCAASFVDSTVYFTEIQPVDSAVVTKRKGFLVGRQMYSEQMLNHLQILEGAGQVTCAVYFSNKSPRLKKKYEKMMDSYRAQKHLSVKTLPKSDFTFVKADWIEPTGADEAPAKRKGKTRR